MCRQVKDEIYIIFSTLSSHQRQINEEVFGMIDQQSISLTLMSLEYGRTSLFYTVQNIQM